VPLKWTPTSNHDHIHFEIDQVMWTRPAKPTFDRPDPITCSGRNGELSTAEVHLNNVDGVDKICEDYYRSNSRGSSSYCTDSKLRFTATCRAGRVEYSCRFSYSSQQTSATQNACEQTDFVQYLFNNLDDYNIHSNKRVD